MRRFAVGAALLLTGVALVGGGVLVVLRTHQAPPPFALSTPQAAGSPSAIAGKWTVAAGSQVGYRAREKFINQPAETEAVARTSDVTGSVVVTVSSGVATVSKMSFSVSLASLASQDKYATYQVYQRDFFVRTIYLQTDSYPTAMFSADNIRFPLPQNGALSIDVKGKLTVHGVTKDEIAHVQASATGSEAEVVGTISVDMRDFGIDPPDISFTRAEPVLTIELDLKLVHA